MPSLLASLVIVAGDDRGNLVFANGYTGAVLTSTTLPAGSSMTAPALIRDSTAYFGEGRASGASRLHAYDLRVSPVADRWGAGLSVDGSVDATPVSAGGALWFGTSRGNLVGVANARSASPTMLGPFSIIPVSASATARTAFMLQPFEAGTVVLVSERGLYAVDVSGSTPSTLWTALGGVDLRAVRPLRIGDTLFCAEGATLYAVTVAPPGVRRTEAIDMPGPIAVLIRLSGDLLLAGYGASDFQLLRPATRQSLAQFSLPSASAAWTRPDAEGVLSFSATAGGSVILSQVVISAAGAANATPVWSQSIASAFAGPPVRAPGLVLGVTTDGRLYGYTPFSNAPIIAGVPILPAGVGAVALASGDTVDPTTTASLRFLLDGEAFFPALRDSLIAVLRRSFAAPQTLPADLSFEGLVKAIGAAGIPAYVLMWGNSALYEMWSDGNWTKSQIFKTLGPARFGRLFDSNGAFRGDFRLNSQTAQSLSGAPNVKTYLEPYVASEMSWLGYLSWVGSCHGKIIIASVAGEKIALVSGFNTITPSYYDTAQHTMRDASGAYSGESWHDTGVVLKGSAVDAIEAEFDRRWSKGNPSPAPGDTYVKFANWQIARGSILGPATAPPAYADPRPTATPVRVEVLLTSNENYSLYLSPFTNASALLSGVHQVLDRLVAQIAAATSYIFFENFTFNSVDLVAALAARLRANPPPGFQIILMVPHPTVDEFAQRYSASLGALQITRMACAALKLFSADWDYFTLNEGDQVQRSQLMPIELDPRGIEYTTLTFAKGATARTVTLYDVGWIHDVGNPPQVVVCAPARYFAAPPADSGKALQGYPANFRAVYIHSKLALFDDKVAVVGSANFTNRSLRSDGELSVLIDDAATALAIRQQLFAHWGMGAPSTWVADMDRFAAATAEALGVLPLRYETMPLGPVSWTYEILGFAIDPSQLF